MMIVKFRQCSDAACCVAAPLPTDMSEALQTLDVEAPDNVTLQELL